MNRVLVWSGILLFAVSCFAQTNELDVAQKNELGVVLGNTWSFNSNTIVSRIGFLPVAIGTGTDSRFTYELSFARRLASFKPANLSLELTAADLSNSFRPDLSALFVIPAAKFSFLPGSHISPFVSSGVGFVHFPRLSNAVAYQFAGGFDVKTPVRFLTFRAEARDFLASQPGTPPVNPFVAGATVKEAFRNHAMAGGGLVVRF